MATEIPHYALIVLIAGGQARLIRNTGTNGATQLEEERRFARDDFESNGTTGTDEAVFARQIALVLGKMHELDRAAHIVLVADAPMLGEMRAALPEKLRHAVIAWLQLDPAALSTPELAQFLTGDIAEIL